MIDDPPRGLFYDRWYLSYRVIYDRRPLNNQTYKRKKNYPPSRTLLFGGIKSWIVWP